MDAAAILRVTLGVMVALACTVDMVAAGRHGMDAAAVAARVVPAVVSITTRHVHEDSPERGVVRRGVGSGVIVDRRGFISRIITSSRTMRIRRNARAVPAHAEAVRL